MDSLIEWSENTLKERMPIAHERYTRILHWLVEGYSAKEIAEFEDVSVHRASTMIYDLKALLRKAREEDGI